MDAYARSRHSKAKQKRIGFLHNLPLALPRNLPKLKHPKLLVQSQSGMALGILLVLMSVGIMVTAMMTSGWRQTSRMNANQSSKTVQNRADIAQTLSNFILYSAALSQSLFDQSCLQNQVIGQNNVADQGASCLLHNRGQASLDSSSPDADERTYYQFKLKSPFSGALSLAGTRNEPACYDTNGNLCTDSSCQCIYKAYTLYKPGTIPSLNAISVGGSINMDQSVTVRVKLVATELAKLGTGSAQKEWISEAQLRLSEINQRQNPQMFNVCVENGSPKPGYVKVAGRASAVANNGNGLQYETDICVPALGTKICPPDQYQIGISALGEPVCSGTRTPCGVNQVPVGLRDTGTGNIQVQCMDTECRYRTGSSGTRVFGFVSPKAADTTQVSCVLVEPENACLQYVKNTMRMDGKLGCDTQTVTPVVVPPSTCPAGSVCANSTNPGSVTTSDPPPGPTWTPTDPPCPGGVCPTVTPTDPFSDFKPAFATRGPGCISCHTTVTSDFMTDFGAGSPWFWGKRSNPIVYNFGDGAKVLNTHSFYSDFIHASSTTSAGFASTRVNGRFVMPRNLMIPTDEAVALTQTKNWIRRKFETFSPAAATYPSSVLSYLQTYAKTTECAQLLPGETFDPSIDNYKCRIVGTTPNFIPTEVDSIYIGAPTETEIQAVGARLPATGAFRYKAIATINGQARTPRYGDGSFSGISTVSGGNFKTDGGTINCDGDLYVPGNLLLRNTTIQTRYGCRMYVTGHVFISGTLSIPKESTNYRFENLQITSAKSINIGLGDCSCSAACQHVDQATIDYIATYDANMANRLSTRTTKQMLYQRYAEWDSYTRSVPAPADRIPFADGVAAAVDALSVKDQMCEASGRNVNLERVLFNAPYIHNRFQGSVKGSMIAEIIMNSLTNFAFQFDDVFSRIPVLPLLEYNKFLSVNGQAGTNRGASVTPGNY